MLDLDRAGEMVPENRSGERSAVQVELSDGTTPPVGWGPYAAPDEEPSRLARWRGPIGGTLGLVLIAAVVALAYLNRSMPIPPPQSDRDVAAAPATGPSDDPADRSSGESSGEPAQPSEDNPSNDDGEIAIIESDGPSVTTESNDAPTSAPDTTTAPTTETPSSSSSPTPGPPRTTPSTSSPSTVETPQLAPVATPQPPPETSAPTPTPAPIAKSTTPEPTTSPQGPGRDAVFFEGSWYEAVDSGQNWRAANKTANERGGHLVHIDSKAENDFIRDTFAGPQPVWIGMRDLEADGVWTLTDGKPATYLYWREGKPDNEGGDEFYARMAYPGGRWDDGPRNASTWYTGTRWVEAESLTVVEFEG